MLFNLILVGVAFVEANLPIAVLLVATMSYIKKATEVFGWRKPWMLTVAAFLLGFLFAIPEGGIVDYLNFAVTGLFLGFVATGVYDAVKSAVGRK
ncbi:MAG: hypothetical protein WC484_08630 [Candidatus Omnitrophota bacterium]|jgi:uncharacterized membrane protein YoaK (UPF0700 family)